MLHNEIGADYAMNKMMKIANSFTVFSLLFSCQLPKYIKNSMDTNITFLFVFDVFCLFVCLFVCFAWKVSCRYVFSRSGLFHLFHYWHHCFQWYRHVSRKSGVARTILQGTEGSKKKGRTINSKAVQSRHKYVP